LRRLPEHRRSLGSSGIHDCAHIVHPHLEIGCAGDAVRKPGAALVEQDKPREPGKARKEIDRACLLPDQVEVGDEARDEDQIELPLPTT